MADLSLEQINDLFLGTLKELGPAKFQQIAQNLQDYEIVGNWFKRDKVQFDHGLGIQRNLMITLSKQARHVGVMATDSVDIPSLMAQLSIQWRHATVGWAFNYQEILVNRGRSLIYNVVKPRRIDALISLAEELESKGWTVPAATDNLLPWGVPFWIVYTATAAPGGFTGGLPAGFSNLAGINLTQAPNFKNYSCTYANVSKPDLITSMRSGHRKLRWRAPIGNADYAKGKYGNLRAYMNNNTYTSFEAVGEAQNENLGRDVAPFGNYKDGIDNIDGVLTFRRHPMIWVPQLDDTSVFTAATNPVYLLDHSTFYPVCLAGDFLRESPVIRAPLQHNTFRVFIDITYNYLCVDRRRNAVFSN